MSDEDFHILAIDPEGQRHKVPALEGWTLMEILRDAGLPIKAECGGACSCATCHVYIDREWLDKMRRKSIDEDDMLFDQAFKVDEERSRLSCQILFSSEINGLKLTIAESPKI